jgi:hypothetical protein
VVVVFGMNAAKNFLVRYTKKKDYLDLLLSTLKKYAAR